MELTCDGAITYGDSRPNKPNAVNFRAIYRLQPKSARFSENMNAATRTISPETPLGTTQTPPGPTQRRVGTQAQPPCASERRFAVADASVRNTRLLCQRTASRSAACGTRGAPAWRPSL